jgi:serine/threonine protein kinase
MVDRQKSIVAALLAVHGGRISPDEAAAALEDPEKTPTLMQYEEGLPTVTLSSSKGPRVATLPEVLDSPKLQQQALREIGIGDTVQQTLFECAADGENGRRVIRDTLQAVASTGRDLNSRGGFQPAGDDDDTDGETHVPSQVTRRTLRLTTGRFFPNYGPESDRYEVKSEHARGGMGRVMLAKDNAVGREVALKELLPGMAGGSIPASVPAGVTDSGGIVERFLREARITGQLEHPNIVPVYEIGQYGDGSFYYTMRFIRGRTLADRLREIRKDAALAKTQKLALRIKMLDQFIDVCNAIAYAHSRGVINRDIKPENIMLGDFGETLVLDWGLARLKGQEDKALDDLRKGTLALSKSLLDADSEALTLDGSIVGTPAYMAPEQARGELEAVDERSDVYSLGAVLYQILTGYPPYEGPMAALIVQSVLAGPPVDVRTREPNVPRELVALVDRAMAREKADRLPSALELAREVKAFRDGRTLGSYSYTPRELLTRFWRQNRTAAGIAVLGFLVVVAAIVFFMQRLTDERDAAQLARVEAEREQQSASNALKVAQQERDERARLEQQAADRAREEYRQRLREAERVLGTIEGMRIGPAMEDLQGRLARYEAEMKGPPQRQLLELSPAEQTGNSVLLSNMLGYISARQNLVELLTGPAGAELPEAFRKLDLAAERRELDDLRLRTGRLCGRWPTRTG